MPAAISPAPARRLSAAKAAMLGKTALPAPSGDGPAVLRNSLPDRTTARHFSQLTIPCWLVGSRQRRQPLPQTNFRTQDRRATCCLRGNVSFWILKRISSLHNAKTNTGTKRAVLYGALSALSSAVVIGSMAVTFGLSFAAIIYAGPLAPFLSQGIGLILIGSTIMALIAPMALTYRGGLIQPQDVCAILFSLCAATIAAMPGLGAEVAFSTVVTLVGGTSIVTGVAAYAMGHFKLGYLVRFMPFPVISGFLAASGALLVKSAFGMAAPGAEGIGELLVRWPQWVPWLVAGVGILAVARLSSNGFGIPLALALSLGSFFAITAAMGLDLEAMRGLGLLLGPFQSTSFASGLNFGLVAHADWTALLSQVPVIAAIVGISLLGMLLNASGMELAIDREIDFEKDLKGVGMANIAAGMLGGLVGYHTLSETLLARRFGVVGAGAGLSVAAMTGFVLFFGAEVLAYLPIGLFAAVVWFLGFDLMLTAIRDQGMLMPRLEMGIVLAMPVIALLFGFMTAVGFGIVMVVLLFVITYSRVDVTRLSTTAANFHARVERAPSDSARLADLGACVGVYRLEGFLFFGSASRLVDRLQRQLGQTPKPKFAIVDLKKVVGLDMSAWAAFERLGRSCGQQGTQLIMTGLSPKLAARFGRLNRNGRQHFRLANDLDDVLLQIEEDLLTSARGAQSVDAAFGPEADTANLLQKYGTRIELVAGEELLAQGTKSDYLVFLLSGRLRATVTDRNQDIRIVSRFLPGAILGEIAYYAGVNRTATVTAETDSTVVRMDAAALALMERNDAVAAAHFHRTLATVLARRLMTTTRLLNDAEL
ncbi:MAG: SulP family inorganic anion transporter [Paracoccaceae bacterium]